MGLFERESAHERRLPRTTTRSSQRDHIAPRGCDRDSLLGSDHAARTVWAFGQSLELGSLRAKIKAVEHAAGRPAIDPAILVASWLRASIEGVGSAREIDRLCERDETQRRIRGGVGVNGHTLAEFRTRHLEWLDAQLTDSIASLHQREPVTMSVVSQDGMRVRVRASDKAARFRRRGRRSRNRSHRSQGPIALRPVTRRHRRPRPNRE